ncbi:DNA cytosine methyltransferase [Oharaeibacter diazotrophicus]|uniref:DNA (cytosine-5-)-methyltransferase n=1 Tax=Oharaeibacter diazotrophicus TaxID=1920512 RepID=A0A4R6RHR2_9HYPH|nr:DNA cytosine methyltransferase [Oharaeibacter diazotrophicus]TDP85377.1 DNA (cytosine-5)-methyltransferase 1 [Oharaeibacter diazotrophicus]BBE74347.1 modification methylase AplI [Pleomorphomonas sp. SM30]GLS75960.1 type II DNA modification methyltransferase [Oharaeibacter diazotrophicus]
MRELIVDSFAGGGGASTGIEMALGRSPDYAINHDPEALALHAANHPDTVHLSRNIWQVDPLEVVGRRPVGLLWASPDCKHFSKAKGGKPVKRSVRDLAWTVILWARRARPRVIILENVEEFQHWGPLVEVSPGAGAFIPCPDRKGETFDRWVGELRRLGYRVQWRELRACDYGAPTMRKRLFLIARRDGRPIVWPEPTHGAPDSAEVRDGRRAPWRTAADIVDWSLACPSIFLTKEEGRAVGANRPLADATMARIFKGLMRYVFQAGDDAFLVPITHTGAPRAHPIDEPVRTVTTAARGEHALVVPHVTKFRENSVGADMRAPLPTVTANGHVTRPGGAAPLGVVEATVAPFVAGIAHGDSGGRRAYGPFEPLPTVQAGGNNHALVAPYLVPRYGEREGQEPRTVAIDRPAPAVVPTANGGSLAAALMVKSNFGDKPHYAVGEPTRTIVAGGTHHALVAAFLGHHYGSNEGSGGDPRELLRTVTAGGTHTAEVRAFLAKYYDTAVGQDLREPLHTATTKPRFGLVTIHGEPYEIVDIGMRMLSPRELFRAQGFPDDYVIAEGDFAGERRALTKTAQVRMCGNSVCPPIAAALVAANCADMAERREAAE